MKGRLPHIAQRLRRFAGEESGTALVEFGLAISIMLLLFFGLVDFGRLAFHQIHAEKAMHIAARVAAVRPAACTGVPETNSRGTNTAPPFGTDCGSGAGICAVRATVTCSGSAANPTAAEIWAAIGAALPPGSTIANLRFSYAQDTGLGFLGGPYVPIVTVELQNVTFDFVSPLGQLVGLAGAQANAQLGARVTFPAMSVSMPGEDLAQGTNG